MRKIKEWRPALVDSGLTLDLLAFHTTPIGTATEHTGEAVRVAYAHLAHDLPELILQAKDHYLLSDIPSAGSEPIRGSRLAHDTLAPLVRARFEQSDLPGQRARRILENRAVDWSKSRATLDDRDLELVRDGVNGMRDWTSVEVDLVLVSALEQGGRWLEEKRRRAWIRRAALAIYIAGFVAVIAGVFAAWQWQESEQQRRLAIARLETSQARAERRKHPIRALLLAAEAVKRPFEADNVLLGDSATLLRELIAETGGTPLRDPDPITGQIEDPINGMLDSVGASLLSGKIDTIAFAPNGRWLAASRHDATVSLWDLQNIESVPKALRGDASLVSNLHFDRNCSAHLKTAR